MGVTGSGLGAGDQGPSWLGQGLRVQERSGSEDLGLGLRVRDSIRVCRSQTTQETMRADLEGIHA